ncbi:MAG: tyrosine-type recombinase/integrase [Candidatus Thermoplasmatota archaeon]|jgi:site-specific recombinase XerD|nr:tyrosine-type recombinase/integrase [Candidatus Thermoplasmatota archaeon]
MATAYFLEMHIDVKSADRIFPMGRITVDKYLTKIENATGIKINAHKFRHTFAVRSLLDGVPINVVQKWLAHSSLIVTSVYADVLSMDTSMFMKQVH